MKVRSSHALNVNTRQLKNEKGNLQTHIKSVHHEGQRFPCPNCDFRATRKSHLLRHINSVHEVPICKLWLYIQTEITPSVTYKINASRSKVSMLTM